MAGDPPNLVFNLLVRVLVFPSLVYHKALKKTTRTLLSFLKRRQEFETTVTTADGNATRSI